MKFMYSCKFPTECNTATQFSGRGDFGCPKFQFGFWISSEVGNFSPKFCICRRKFSD